MAFKKDNPKRRRNILLLVFCGIVPLVIIIVIVILLLLIAFGVAEALGEALGRACGEACSEACQEACQESGSSVSFKERLQARFDIIKWYFNYLFR